MTNSRWAAVAAVTVTLVAACASPSDQSLDPADYYQQPYLNQMPRTCIRSTMGMTRRSLPAA